MDVGCFRQGKRPLRLGGIEIVTVATIMEVIEVMWTEGVEGGHEGGGEGLPPTDAERGGS